MSMSSSRGLQMHSIPISVIAAYFTLIHVGGVVDSSPPSTLKQVNLLYRHGDRSPNLMYPNDAHQENAWPDGLGWLTNIGKQQQFELGKYLRQRYDGFINVTRYDHREISVQSSAKDRCLMSAQANLAGMFPPEGDQVWHDDLLWQPIPIHSVPRPKDNKLGLVAECPRYHYLFTNLYKTKLARDYQKRNQGFFDWLSNRTGFKEKSTFMNTWMIIDPVVCERAHNMTLNGFLLEDGVLDKLDEIQHLSWSLLYHTTEMARLMGGPLLKEIIENMKTADSSDVKLHMYSGHDSTVSALLNAMTVSNKMQPPYFSLILVELHSIDNQDVVKILYRNDTQNEPRYLLPKGCEDPCKLSTFQSLMADRVPKDWQKECEIPNNSAPPHLSSSSSLSLLSIPVLFSTLRLVVVRSN